MVMAGDNRVFLLNEDDTIKPGDFARPLDLLYIGQSDYLHTENTYSGKPMNHTRWVTVERLGWGSHIVGRMTVAEYNEWCDSLEKPHQASSRYEFCRGSLPEYRQLRETNRERSIREGNCVVTFGKYKGMTIRQLESRNPAYFMWAKSEGLVEVWVRDGNSNE